MKAQVYYRRWLIQAPISLIVIGFGVCLIAEAALRKFQDQSWFWPGTIALVVLNTGVCLFGDAVLYRMRYERASQEN